MNVDWASVLIGLLLGIAGLGAGLWSAAVGSRDAALRLQQERDQFERKLNDERARFEREVSEATLRAERELAEQRSQRLADRRAMVYVDLTRFLVTEDEKLYDNHPLVGTVRGDPTETPAYGDPTLDVQLRAFASEGVLELVEDWRKSVSIVVRLMGQIEQEADYGAKLDLEQERNDYSGYSHETVVKIQRLVRLELSPQPHSG